MTDVTSEPSLDRRVRRLENETESIYELIGDIRSTQQLHTQRLDTIDTRLDGVEARLDGVETKLLGIGVTLQEVVRRLPDPDG
ncbi:hypothetical protein JCM18899A_14970 [Nocardioides sp. AN3]